MSIPSVLVNNTPIKQRPTSAGNTVSGIIATAEALIIHYE